MSVYGNALGRFGVHLGAGCLDNVTDPGWCVWCGRNMRWPIRPAVSVPAETAFPVAVTVHPAWYMWLAGMWGGDVS